MRWLAVAAAAVLALPASAAAQGALDPVRELYATADYEGALAALSRVKEAPADPAVGRQTDYYRVLCLMALERLPEAEQAIDRILRADPLYRLSAEEVPPRVLAAFDQVRRRVAPAVARQLYESGKEAYQRQEFGEARALLERALRIMNDPTSASAPGLSDFKVLADGFRDLTLAALKDASRPEPTPGRAQAAGPAPATTAAWSEPVAQQQTLPPWPGAAGGPLFDREFIGAVEVDIDATGRVTAARMAVPIHPSYDLQLLTFARSWRYEPARQAGRPVAAKKRIDIRLRPR